MLLLKLFLVPSLVAAVTLASRRWGLRVGGVLTGLPMVAGPTLCFYAIEQGNPFAASAARSAMLGIVATAAFCVAYSRGARRLPWAVCIVAGWVAFGIVAAAAYRVPDFGGIGELVLASSTLVAARRLIPAPPAVAVSAAAPRWDLPLRMLASSAAVVLFTGLAEMLGARLSGVLSAFPVVTLVLAVFTHVQRGHPSVSVFLRGVLRGLHGFALFCVVFSVVLGALRWNLAAALSLALAAQIALQSFILWRMSAAARSASPSPNPVA